MSFCFYIPELEYLSRTGGDTEHLIRTLLPYTAGVLLIAALVFVFSAVHNLRTEISREKIKKSYEKIDEEYQTFVETTADGFIYIQSDEVMTADEVVLSMLGYSTGEFLRLKPEEIIHRDVDGIELLDHLSSPEPDITGRYETRLIRKDNSTVDVLISASAIETPLLEGFVLIVKDMSDRTRTDAVRLDVQREYSIIDLQSALQYIYQNAGSMMEEPLVFEESVRIIDAVEEMNSRHKNTFVVAGPGGEVAGIVTDQDLRQRVISGELSIEDPVKLLMSSPVVTAEPGIMFFEAFQKMRENSIRQLVIADGDGKPAGLLTEKKLIQIQSTNSAVLFEQLSRAENVEQLHDCYRSMIFSVRTLVLSGAKAVNIAAVVSRTAEMITQKLIEFEFVKLGPPPCEFAYLAMGSEGRGEQTLLTDQDNGIVFEDVPEEKLEICRDYFLRLGTSVSDSLNYIGYSYCKGGVMTSNPKWVRSESEWKDQFWSWVNGTATEQMLDVNIIFDFKCIYGNKQLSRELRTDIWETVNRFPSFLREMAATVSEFKPPLTPFGRIQVEHTEHDDQVFDIKKALSPLIIYARTLSLREKLEETSTTARLRVLEERDVITTHQFQSYEHAFEYLTLLRFRDQIRTIEEGEPLDNLIYIEELMDVEILTLRKIFKQISRAQDDLRFTFTGTLR